MDRELGRFHFKLLIYFIALIFAGCYFGYRLYTQLDQYQKSIPEGGLEYLTQMLQDKEYDRIYDLSGQMATQYNTRSDYTKYLIETFDHVNLDKVYFVEENYSYEEFKYFNMMDEHGEKVGLIQIKKMDNGVTEYTATPVTQRRTFAISTPIVFYVNNTKVEYNYLSAENVAYPCYSGLERYKDSPLGNLYDIDNLIDVPEITVDEDGYVVVKDVLQDNFYIGKQPTKEETEELEEFMQDVASAYSTWISQDTSFWNFSKYLYRNTEYYNSIRNFDNSFYSEHSSYSFDNWEFKDIALLGEEGEGAIGTVSFDYIVSKRNGASRVSSNTYQIVMLKKGRNWQVVNMSIYNE